MSQTINYKFLTPTVKRKINRLTIKIDLIYQEYFNDYYLKDSFLSGSVWRFITQLGFDFVEYAMRTACEKDLDDKASIKYFCGICWTEIKKEVENERL